MITHTPKPPFKIVLSDADKLEAAIERMDKRLLVMPEGHTKKCLQGNIKYFRNRLIQLREKEANQRK